MKTSSHLAKASAIAATTALTGVLAFPVAAQQVQINQDQLSALNDECRTLAENVRSMDSLPEGATVDETVRVLNANEAQQCSDYRTSYFQEAGDQTDESSASAEGTARQSGENTAEATERVRISEDALIEGLARVRVPKPEVDVEVPAPNVRVMAGQPQVSIREGAQTIEVQQQQPQIAVEIPEIRVRVEIPAPKLFIRSDDPSVEVAGGDPQIEVQQQDPRVSVRQGDPEIGVNLDVETEDNGLADATASSSDTETVDGGSDGASGGEVRISRAEPQVTIERAEGDAQIDYASSQPEVSYSGSEPNVTVSMSQQPTVEIARVGNIEVTYETADEREARRQQQQTEGSQNQQASAQDTQGTQDAEQQANAQDMQGDQDTEDPNRRQANAQNAQDQQTGQDGQQSGDTWNVTVADLMQLDVIGADGSSLGSPEAFVRQDNSVMMVLSEGGFLGLGDKEVGVPLSRIAYTDQGLQLQNLTEDEIEDANNFRYDPSMVVADDLEIRINGGS